MLKNEARCLLKVLLELFKDIKLYKYPKISLMMARETARPITRNEARKFLEKILRECFCYDSKLNVEDFDFSSYDEKLRERARNRYIDLCNCIIKDRTGYEIESPDEWDLPDEQEPDIRFNRGRDLIDYVLSEAEGIAIEIKRIERLSRYRGRLFPAF